MAEVIDTVKLLWSTEVNTLAHWQCTLCSMPLEQTGASINRGQSWPAGQSQGEAVPLPAPLVQPGQRTPLSCSVNSQVTQATCQARTPPPGVHLLKARLRLLHCCQGSGSRQLFRVHLWQPVIMLLTYHISHHLTPSHTISCIVLLHGLTWVLPQIFTCRGEAAAASSGSTTYHAR